ncbi:MAG: hypothetical protein M1325_05500 [Actinobacteria bacterium]|nr:hypothetical protein [Actinomycetota bacterium]
MEDPRSKAKPVISTHEGACLAQGLLHRYFGDWQAAEEPGITPRSALAKSRDPALVRLRAWRSLSCRQPANAGIGATPRTRRAGSPPARHRPCCRGQQGFSAPRRV